METIIHFLVPRPSNNHKAKLIQPSILFLFTLVFVIFQFVLNYYSHSNSDILGFSSQINISEVVNITNQKRIDSGLSPLSLNQTLSDAAYTKGKDMINRDYWAHVAPDGTQPWKFFKDFGYSYRYAGENLARDFSSASSAVDAWMNSPSHKENILNPKYKEIGIGVVEGDLSGSDTTIIVQFFGTKYSDKVTSPLAQASSTENTKIPTIPTSEPQLNEIPKVATEVKAENISLQPEAKVLISPFITTKVTSYIIVAILVIVFIVDALIVSRKKILRVSGRSLAHMMFLVLILSIIALMKVGRLI